jgi:hypothetical protein
MTGNDVTGTGSEREINFPRFLPAFPAFCSGTSLDYRYEQWNCESNLYRVTIALLPPMLNHFLNPSLITALTGIPVSMDNEVFQTE